MCVILNFSIGFVIFSVIRSTITVVSLMLSIKSFPGTVTMFMTNVNSRIHQIVFKYSGKETIMKICFITKK